MAIGREEQAARERKLSAHSGARRRRRCRSDDRRRRRRRSRRRRRRRQRQRRLSSDNARVSANNDARTKTDENYTVLLFPYGNEKNIFSHYRIIKTNRQQPGTTAGQPTGLPTRRGRRIVRASSPPFRIQKLPAVAAICKTTVIPDPPAIGMGLHSTGSVKNRKYFI